MKGCRSCGELIRWEKTRDGRNVPLDPEPSSAGDVVLERLIPSGPLVAVQLAPSSAYRYTGEKFTDHRKTCARRTR